MFLPEISRLVFLSLISRVRLKQRAVKKRGGTCVKSPKGLIFVCIVIFLLSLSFTPGEIYAASTITFTGGELLGKHSRNAADKTGS